MKVYEKPNAEIVSFESDSIMVEPLDGTINPVFSGVWEGVGELPNL